MSHLIDTNVLTRLITLEDPLSLTARAAIDQLQRDGERLVVAPQNLIEFWAVATRPIDANGLNLSTDQAIEELTRFENIFRLVEEPPGVFRQWRKLVATHTVKGKQTHDARLAAVMIESGVEHILTFNVDDFRRYPGITAVSPRSFAAPPATSEQDKTTE